MNSKPESNFAAPVTHSSHSLLARLLQYFTLKGQLLFYGVLVFLTNHPYPLRLYFAYLRRARPISVGRRTAFVTRHEDVRDVLDRTEDFLLSELTAGKMLGGPFLLTADWREQHTRERRTLEGVKFEPEDIDRIRNCTGRRCEELIAEARNSGERPFTLNVASGFTELVASSVVQDYLGVPVTKDVMRWLRVLSGVIVVAPPAGSPQSFKAEYMASQLSAHIEGVITTKSKTMNSNADVRPSPDDDFMTRLLKESIQQRSSKPWFNEDWVRRFIFGLAVFGNATVARATTNAFDRLLARGRVLKGAQAVARELEDAKQHLAKAKAQAGPPQRSLEEQKSNVAHIRNLLRSYAYEALRFRPMLPLLARFCPRDTIAGVDQVAARKIAAGHTVVAPPIAGMFDPAVFRRPHRFSVNRPQNDYLHFGHGPHVCFARYMADAEIIEILHALLRLNNVRRTGFRSGRIRFDGPAVDDLWINWD